MAADVAHTRLLRFLDGEVADRRLGCGAQIAVLVHGQPVLTHATGESFPDVPMTEATVYNMYCAATPLWVAALASALDEAHLDAANLRISDVWPELPGSAHARVSDLVAHAVPYRGPNAFEARSADDVPAYAFGPGGHEGFSDFVVPHACFELVERLTGRAAEYLSDDVMEGVFGVEDAFVPARDDQDSTRSLAAIAGTYFFDLPDEPCPLMLDRTPWQIGRTAPIGVFTCSESMAKFLGLYGRVVTSTEPHPWRWLRQATRPRRFDPILGRACGFQAGLMSGLRDHHFGGAPSDAAVGIAGLVGTAFGFYEPRSDAAAFAILNGLPESEEDMAYERSRLISMLYDVIGACGK